jgi:aldose 1-epimerase
MAADRLTLRAGKLQLEIAAEMGGSITAFERLDGASPQPILRDARSAADVLRASSFPLVPFVNRIRDGRFAFRGREVSLRANMAGDLNPLHGQGWLSPWRVEQATEANAVLSYCHRTGEWPWGYEARQEFALDERGLSLVLACRNNSSEPMPCGLGQHPYFPCGPDTRITADVQCAWTIDEQVLPVAKVAATDRYSLNDRRICGQDLDNGFGGWSGETMIRDPASAFDVRLSSPNARYLHIYSPLEGGFFAAEPVTQANAALNKPEEEWPDLGLKVLASGDETALEIRIDVIEK